VVEFLWDAAAYFPPETVRDGKLSVFAHFVKSRLPTPDALKTENHASPTKVPSTARTITQTPDANLV
jgi:hypothetical protein